MSTIAENLARVEDAVVTACRKAGRRREEVRLMAVSKTHPVELLLEAAAAGQMLFGENRVREFSEKTQALAATTYAVELGTQPLMDTSSAANTCPEQIRPDRTRPDRIYPENMHHQNMRRPERSEGPAVPSVPLQMPDRMQTVAVHLIGHLQSNKAARAAEIFTSIDTLDSLRLAERLYEAAQRLDRALPVLIEVKLSPEEAKEGLAPDSPELFALLERLPDLHKHLPLRGLMTVAPISNDPEVARVFFRQLCKLREQLAQKHPRLRFNELSMGMSGDFEAAIEEGSTTIRIGTAIFGARPKPQ